MTWTAFLLVFLSVFLHASWNFLSKKRNPSGAFYLVMAVTATAATSVFFFISDLPLAELPGKFWGLLGCSLLFEIIYNLGLAYGYRVADISLIYPLGRALPVLLVAVVTMVCGFGAKPGNWAFVGMAVIFGGCVLLPMKDFKSFELKTYCNKAAIFILMIAVGTTGYTIVDSQAGAILKTFSQDFPLVRSMLYLFFIEFGIMISLALYVALMRWERQELKYVLKAPQYPAIAGIFSATAYGLVLVAMGFVSNVSYVQAFRQLSLPLGVLLGVIFLKENPAKPKLAGVALIVIGLVLTVL